MCGSRTTLSAKPQLDPPLFPIQNEDPCTVPPMLLMIGFLSWVAIHPHLLEDYDTPGEEQAALPLITGDNTMSSYEGSLCELPFHFLTFKRVSFQPMSEKKTFKNFHSLILLLVVRVFLKGAVNTKLKSFTQCISHVTQMT